MIASMLPNESFWHVTIDLNNWKIVAEEQFSSRFKDDKCFITNDDYVLIADGLLLNKKELLGKYNLSNYGELMLLACRDRNIVKEFRGCFTGFCFDCKRKEGYAFTNQTGDVSVYYFIDTETNQIIISNDFETVKNRIDPQKRILDSDAANCLLTFGYIINDATICRDIKRLQAGKMLDISKDGVSVSRYHRFKFIENHKMSKQEILSETDRLFRQAVKRCFDKDIEYGYHTHLADLSAGLDSRMVNWVAKDLGYDNIVNVSYSQSFTDEDKYTQILANKLHNSYFHHSLDDASFLYEIDDMTRLLYGLAYYCGITGGNRMLRLIDVSNFGVEHTGQVGDAVLSTFGSHQSANINPDVYRNSQLLPYVPVKDLDEFDTQQEYCLYTRGFQGALATHYLRNRYTYALSPFLDVDFMEFVFTVPHEYRKDHLLYWDWIEKYYPDAAKLPSSRSKAKNPVAVFFRKVKGRSMMYIRRFARKANMKQFAYKSNHMNPHDKWYAEDANIRNFITQYYENNIDNLNSYPEIKKNCSRLFNSQLALDKLMAISLLSSLKYLKS